MAIAYDAITTTSSTTTATSLSLNHTASGTDRLAVVIVHIMRNSDAGVAVTAATYGGNAMTERATIENRHAAGSKTYRTSIYTYTGPPTSSTAVSVTWDQNAIASALAVMTYTGVDQTTPYDANGTANISITNNATVSVTTATADAWIVGGLMMRGGDTDPFAAGTGVEEKYDLETGTDTTGDFGAAGGYRVATSTGSYALAWTAAVSDTGVIAAISIKPKTAGTIPASSADTIEFTETAAPVMYYGSPHTYEVTAGGDDAREANGGAVTLTDNPIRINSSYPWGGMIFRGVYIPVGATVTAAYLEVYPNDVLRDSPGGTIRGERNPANFAATANNLSGRTKTATEVGWSAANIGTGTYKQSPDIKTVIQEIIGTSWSGYGDIAIYFYGPGGDLQYHARDYSGNLPPRLYVAWTIPVVHQATATDGIDFTPSTARRAIYRNTAADGLGMTDARTPRRVRRPVATDNWQFTETRTPRRIFRATVTESVGLAAAVPRRANYRAAPVDLLELLEVALRGGRVTAAAADALDVTDAATPGYHIRRVAADTWQLTPNAVTRTDWRVTVADAVDLSEAALYPLPSDSGTVDIVAYEDSSQGSDGVINIGNNESSVRATNPYNALEFRNLDVPRYAVPTVAYISLYTVTADDPGLTIRAEDTASPATLSTTTNDISSRSPLTTASVEWSAANIGLGAYKQSPDLSAIFAELFALPDWARGTSDVVLILSDNGTGGHLRYQTTEGANDPKLYIEWYLGGLTITATAADALAVMESADRRAIVAAATADSLSLATATTTAIALLVADDLSLTEMVGTLARLSIADALVLGDSVFLTYAMTLTEPLDLFEAVQRIAALRAASVDALDYTATARVKISTAAGDAIDLTDALTARRILAAIAADALRLTLITTGDIAGVLEAIATDALDLSAVANAGWHTRATAVDALDVNEALTALRRFLALAHDAGAIDDVATALKRARATATDAAGLSDALRSIMRTRAVDLLEFSETTLSTVAAILHALAADVVEYSDGTALNWRVTARDTLEFTAAIGAVMHWVESVQDALGLHGAAVFLLPNGIVRVEFAINAVTVQFDVAMPRVDTVAVQPRIDIEPHGLTD